MLDFEEVNVLGQLLDTTWGRSSNAGAPTISVKGKIQGDKILLTYTSYATFASSMAQSQQLPRFIDEGKQATALFIKKIRADFKTETGKTLSMKVLSSTPSVEIISLQPHVSPRRTVSFRFLTIAELF